MNQKNDVDSNLLEKVIAKYLHAVDGGEMVDRDELLRQHPAIADSLQAFFRNHEEMVERAQPFLTDLGDPTVAVDLDRHNPIDVVSYFGDYQLLEEIARGGMGVVFRAKQLSLNRLVAIKMILSGRLATQADVARFKQEAEAAANLDHPNIVPIYEIGEHEGHHYFCMKLIEGMSLATVQKMQKSKRMSQERIARIMAVVAHAVHHAHQRGILHRDIKPGNILIDGNDQPHVTDFGLAKRFENPNDLTHTDVLIGTPSYMAPEQALGQSGLTTGVDVYALGAVLFELLFGRPPFQAGTPAATIAQILSSDSIKIPTDSPKPDRDLETIALKCLERDPSRRYDSAAALADDLTRWLDREPILARRSSVIERIGKWAWRRPALASMSGLVLATVCVAIFVVMWQWKAAVLAKRMAEASAIIAMKESKRATEEQKNAERLGVLLEAERDSLDRQRYLAQMQLASREWQLGNRAGLLDLLERQLPATGKKDHRSWEWYFLKQETQGSLNIPGMRLMFSKLEWSPDNKRIVASGYRSNHTAGELRVFDSETGEEDANFAKSFDYGLMEVAWSPDGSLIATGGGKIAGFQNTSPGKLEIWNAKTGKHQRTITGHMGAVNCISWHLDSKRIVVTSGEFGPPAQIMSWNVETGERLRSFEGNKHHVAVVQWSPDCTKIASGSSYGQIHIWDADTANLVANWTGHAKAIHHLYWSPDGNRLAAAGPDNVIKVWNAADGELIRKLSTPLGIEMSWMDNETIEVTYNTGRCVTVNAANDEATELKSAESGFSGQAAWSRDHKRIALGHADQTIMVEDLEKKSPTKVIETKQKDINSVRWSPDGRQVVVCGSNVSIWNVADSQLTREFPWPNGWSVHIAEFSPNGKWIATSSLKQFSGTIHVLDVENGKVAATWNGHVGPVMSIEWSPDSQRFATAGVDEKVRIWDASAEDKQLAEYNSKESTLSKLAWHPRDNRLAITRDDGGIAIWSLDSNEIIEQSFGTEPIRTVAWKADGSQIVIGGVSSLKFLHGQTYSVQQVIEMRNTQVRAIAFRPREQSQPQRLAVLGINQLKLWDIDAGQEAMTITTESPKSFAWRPDGQGIAVVDSKGTITIRQIGAGTPSVSQ